MTAGPMTLPLVRLMNDVKETGHLFASSPPEALIQWDIHKYYIILCKYNTNTILYHYYNILWCCTILPLL